MIDWKFKPDEISEKIKNMTWSFSRVNALSSCKWGWVLKYVLGCESAPNAYAQFGTVCHETLEKYLKGELDLFDVPQYYQDRYAELVTCSFPSNKYVDLGQKAYNQGLEYFNNINFDFNKYEILGVEKELVFNVGKYPFHGFADAIYRDKDDGSIILRDHKTASFKYLKNGLVSKTNAEHYKQFRYQEYLYCIPLVEMYGKVDFLSWNMIRDQREIKIPFDQNEYEEAQKWCIEAIEEAENELLWLPETSDKYFCSTICDSKNICEYRLL